MQFEHKGKQVSIESLSDDAKPSPTDTNIGRDPIPEDLARIIAYITVHHALGECPSKVEATANLNYVRVSDPVQDYTD